MMARRRVKAFAAGSAASLVASLLLTVIGGAVGVGADVAGAAGHYSIIDIGSLAGANGASAAFAIASNGDVLGATPVPNAPSQPLVYRFASHGLMPLGPVPNPFHGQLSDINAHDVAVGQVVVNGVAQAVEFTGATRTSLAPPEASGSLATAVDDAGAVVGVLSPAEAVQFMGGGAVRDLGHLPGDGPIAGATDINNSGDVVGFAANTPGPGSTFAPVKFSGGVASALPELHQGDSGLPLGISTRGGFVDGQEYLADGRIAAVQFGPGPNAVDLGRLRPGYNCNAVAAVDSSGDGVGISGTDVTAGGNCGGAVSNVLFTHGSVYDLVTLLPANSGWQITSVKDINDGGMITGTGIHNGLERGFIMLPPIVPPLPPPPGSLCPPPNTSAAGGGLSGLLRVIVNLVCRLTSPPNTGS
jgi:hypothetical protein